MIEVLALFGPVLDLVSVHPFHPHESAVSLQPVVVDVMERVLALAAPVVFRILDVGPSIIREDGNARIVLGERGIR